MKRFAHAIAICTNPANQRNRSRDLISTSYRALPSSGHFIRRAARRGTLAIRRNPAITLAQNFHHPGNFRNPHERPAPPNLTRQRHAGVRPAELAAIAQQKSHFVHQFFARHSKQRSHARILQRRQRHPALLQNRRQPSRDSRAELALRVKKQPPARVPPLPVRVFAHQRNHGSISSSYFLASLLPCFLTSLLPCFSSRSFRLARAQQ